LALAIAEGMARLDDIGSVDTNQICRHAERGRRSAVGSHGYFRGGLICERPCADCYINPVQARVELPDSWRVAIFRPATPIESISGREEASKFARLQPAGGLQRDELHAMIADRIVPAARRAAFAAFADAVHEYNRLSGQLFAAVQGGPYNGPEVSELVRVLVDRGARGVGQSSWGPGVFAWFESAEDWQAFRRELPSAVSATTVTSVRNRGRTVLVDRSTAARGASADTG
jgi:predicted sugar kinase